MKPASPEWMPSPKISHSSHFWDGARASVRREWKNIDLLIELPTPNEKGKGLVVAVELKINAKESDDQLKNYQSTIEKEYKNWKQAFVFLTKSEDEASGDNADLWMPLGMETLLDHLGETVKHQQFSGPSAELFDAYDAMMRRHHLSNTKLEELTKKIWEKHGEALNILYDNWPNDYLGDVYEELSRRGSKIAKAISEKTNKTIVLDGDALQFTVQDWDSFDEMRSGTGEWSGAGRDVRRILRFHVDYGKSMYSKMLLGSSRNEVFRMSLVNEYSERINSPEYKKMQLKKPRSSKKWTTLTTIELISQSSWEKAKKENKAPKDFADKVEEKFIKKWSKLLRLYFEVVEAAGKVK